MAKIFISYGRQYVDFARKLATSLSAVGADIWLDVDDIPAGMNWSNAIQQGLDNADLMIVVITPEAMASRNVENEWQYYLDEGKPVIPVLLLPAKVHFQLRRLQYVNFQTQAYELAFRQLHSELRRKGVQLNPLSRNDDSVQLPPQQPLPLREETGENGAERVGRPAWLFPAVIVAALALFVLVFVLFPRRNELPETTPDSAAQTDAPEVAAQPTPTQADSQTVEASETPSATPTATATNTATASITPPPTATLDIALVVATLDAEATVGQATLNAQSTAAARATEYAVGTQSAVDQTATATLWTHTPTPDITASIDAFRTQQAATVTQAWIDSWTDTPTPTYTPSNTPTATATYTPTLTLTPTATLTELDAALARARAFTGTNADWQPFTWTFDDGVEMALVPVGCFMMGSDDGESDEQPVREQCFTEPFWIDRTEVTQGDFARLGGVAADENYFNGADRPRESITWFEARDFCALRGARLPTEREWEYAARGPANWVYPWGNQFVAENVVYSENSNGQTANVGSRPNGASWVGALDMSGNVWEWVNTIYGIDLDGDYNFSETGERSFAYPYSETDGREADSDERTHVRVLRGGSCFSLILRASDRGGSEPDYEYDGSGFRCVRFYNPES